MKEVVRRHTLDTMDTLVQQTESPFTAEVLHFPLPVKFRMPQVEAFDGTRDPVDHLNTYKNQMELHGYQDPVRCTAFAITLKGPALAWFNRLPPSSISSFRELSIAFVSHFIGARTHRKPSYHLLTIKQSSQESLSSYVQRFNAESPKVDIPRGGKIGPTRWASPVRPELGPGWAIKLLARKKPGQICPSPVWPGPALPA